MVRFEGQKTDIEAMKEGQEPDKPDKQPVMEGQRPDNQTFFLLLL